MARSLDRQSQDEANSPLRTVLPAQLTPGLLGDLPRDRQPEPGALRLGGEERLEQALRDLMGDAGARVAHGDLHVITIALAGQREPAASREGLQPVLHEIDDR